MKWHMFAGGTAAASGKHGYTAKTAFGTYDIQPLSRGPYGRHIGYVLYFINDKGKLSGGLWQRIGSSNYRSPNEAKGAANSHFKKHFGKKGRK